MATTNGTRARRTPTPASVEVFDLDAARAQRFEAGKPDKFSFRFCGADYHMPLDLKSSVIRELRGVDADDLEAVFGVILGEDAAAGFFENDPTLRDLLDLMQAYEKAVGISLPK